MLLSLFLRVLVLNSGRDSDGLMRKVWLVVFSRCDKVSVFNFSEVLKLI